MKTVAIIQARMGATRLPGKMMMDLAGQPVVQRVFERVKPSRFINEIWLATTINSEDDVLAEWAARNRFACYRGSSEDVLDRYYQAALKAKAEVIVRITGDCPLHDPEVIDKVIESCGKGNQFDYVSNIYPPTYPDGLDIEVFSFEALKKTWQEAKLPSEREHVTAYIWKHPEKFKIRNISHSEDLSFYRWTLDTSEDLRFLRLIFEELQKRHQFGHLAEVLAILQEHPDWLKINAQYRRNEGYQKSLKEDQL